MRSILFAIITLLAVSCVNDENDIRPKEANMMCDKFYAKGQKVFDTFTFCSTMPVVNEYSYRKGEWTYWNKEGNLIARGIFKTEIRKIDDHGGCTYEFKYGVIDKKSWQFWDGKGNEIKASEELIRELNACHTTLISTDAFDSYTIRIPQKRYLSHDEKS